MKTSVNFNCSPNPYIDLIKMINNVKKSAKNVYT